MFPNNAPSNYGSILRIVGLSEPNNFVNDSYYISSDSNNNFFSGKQINGSQLISWEKMATNSDLPYLNPILISLTPGDGVTIKQGGFYKIGKYVFIYLEIEISSNLSSGNIICKNLPTSKFINSIILGVSGATVIPYRIFSENLYCNGELQPGTHRISGFYITN